MSDGVPGYVPVARAAVELGVSASRVRDLVAAGQLDAVRPGHELLVDEDSIRRRLYVVRPAAGRPLSPRMAWAVLWLASARQPTWVSPAELSRARRYLRERSLKAWPRLLGNRAEVHRGRMLPGTIERLRDSSGVSAGGISAVGYYGLDLLPAGDEYEFYLESDRFAQLKASHRIMLDADRPNVVLRVPALAEPDLVAEPVVPLAVVAADLLDDGGERGNRAAMQLLARLGIDHE